MKIDPTIVTDVADRLADFARLQPALQAKRCRQQAALIVESVLVLTQRKPEQAETGTTATP